MKKIFLTTLFLLTVLLGACTTVPATSESSTAVAELVNQGLTAAAPGTTNVPAETGFVELTSDYENAVSVEMQLALGTMNLEGTENGISKEQAAALLPLWSSFSTLSQNMMPDGNNMVQGQAVGTPQPPTVNKEVQKQLTELTGQIQSSLTAEQIQAIGDMKITQESAQTIMQELELEMTTSRGGMEGGAPSDVDGQGATSGQPPSGDQGMSMPPTDGGQMRSGGIQPQLLEALIKLLETKSAS